ncbi:MAG TPA: hypothetical protein VEG68_08835 [Terriglobales bacterium]|nr:hypothetical protein [Terriglobales bacterium]
MTTVQEFAETFPNEIALQQALAKLLSKIPGHTGVQILQGSQELGKDLIFYTPGAFGQRDLNACVVKNTRITGSASSAAGARTVFNQAQQALDTPLPDENGKEQKVSRVFIITPHPIPPETVSSIIGALKASDERVQFIGGASLLELFKVHWPEYLAEEFGLIHAYAAALTETTASAKELSGLSFQYQLGTTETSIKRVYVQPHLHRFLRSYSLRPLYQTLSKHFEDRTYTHERIEDVVTQITNIDSFMSVLANWGLCAEISKRAAVRSACTHLIDGITTSWSRALSARATRTKAGDLQSTSVALRLSNINDLNKLFQLVNITTREALQGLEKNLQLLSQYIKRLTPQYGMSFSAIHETIINQLGEIARVSGSGCIAEDEDRSTTFSGSMIADYQGSLFVVAPAGFGKTSFCRWNALNDLQKLLDGQSSTLPVYVPLHQVGDVSRKDFKQAFLQHAGISALLPKDGQPQYQRTRVYLDGLDEVPSAAAQKRISRLAEDATKQDSSLQVVITARDYVYGPWMTWVPRLHLSGFDDEQLKELVAKWLENDERKILAFFEQLERSQSLKEMMTVPLLATLIVLVFKQTAKLPENKTRLYEIFVDLHNGGWDLAKSVQRPSQFSATQKLFILKRIAASIHKEKRREMLEADVSSVARETLKDSNWKVLRSELLRDGLIVEMGSMISFAHHSFQEFLTARYLLGHLNVSYLTTCCDEYLGGSDWWQEVLFFYVDLAGKPQETLEWIDERLRRFTRFPGAKSAAARERALLLTQHLAESFPYAKCEAARTA